MHDIDPKELLEFVKDKSLVEVVLYYWTGKWATPQEARILEEIMILAVDHGPDSPSAKATIAASLGKQDVIRSVEAGIGEIDAKHGGAIEGLAEILQNDQRTPEIIVKDFIDRELRLPGFGHRLYKEADPRASYMLRRLDELGLHREITKKALTIGEQFEQQKKHHLPLNIDGAMAIVLSELGVKPEMMNAFFLWPRVAGLAYRWKVSQEG